MYTPVVCGITPVKIHSLQITLAYTATFYSLTADIKYPTKQWHGFILSSMLSLHLMLI